MDATCNPRGMHRCVVKRGGAPSSSSSCFVVVCRRRGPFFVGATSLVWLIPRRVDLKPAFHLSAFTVLNPSCGICASSRCFLYHSFYPNSHSSHSVSSSTSSQICTGFQVVFLLLFREEFYNRRLGSRVVFGTAVLLGKCFCGS